MRVYSEITKIYRVIQIKLSQFEKMSIMNNPNSFTMQLAVILPGAVGAYRESPGLPTVFDGRVKDSLGANCNVVRRDRVLLIWVN